MHVGKYGHASFFGRKFLTVKEFKMIGHLKMHAAFLTAFALVSFASASMTTPVAAQTVVQEVNVAASRGRELELRVWRAEEPMAVIVFSAGGNGNPGAYSRLNTALAKRGIVVVAPIHADALARGDLAGSGGLDSFISRIEDLGIAREYARSTYPDVPLVVMGHSFGTMMSSLSAGAVTPAGPQSDPSVKAFIALSSPGLLPGVVTAESYQTLSVPLLLVTGQQDTVPRFVTDWRIHRAIYDNSVTPGSQLVVFHDADHDFVVDADDTQLEALSMLIASFVQASTTGTDDSKARLLAIELDGATIERR